MFTRQHWPYLAAFFVSAILLVIFLVPLSTTEPYSYDSADYMYAGKRGFLDNYTDAGTLSLSEFISYGLELRRNPEKRSEVSRLARSREDIGLYRHYHGPMYAYWIAFWTQMGVFQEATYRNVGLIVHVATALIVTLAFWSLFPGWHPVAGLLTGLMYLFNRTALITSTEITQHFLFTFFAASLLWALGLFCRTLALRYWYLTMVLLALSLATVESAFMLALAIAFCLIYLWKPICERWPALSQRVNILLKGVGLFLVVLFVVWPAGVYKLSVVRGYLYLAYAALERKSFSPLGPFQVWWMKFVASPWELGLGAIGLIAALIVWRKLEYRREAFPWLAYAVIFVVVTLKITIEFTHYRSTIALTMIFATGIAFAYFWTRFKTAIRSAAVAAICIPMLVTAGAFYEEREIAHGQSSPAADVLEYARSTGIANTGKTLYVPFFFVPTLHFYMPELSTAGYNPDWGYDRLAAAVRSPGAADVFLCLPQACSGVQASGNWNNSAGTKQLVTPDWDNQPLYAVRVR